MSNDLSTLANVKQYLNSQTTLQDSLLQRLLSAASNLMQTWMSRNIALTTYSETRNGLGSPVMSLLNTPVTNVSSVYVNGVSVSPRPPLNQTTGSGLGYGFTFDDARVMLSGLTFCRGMQNVTINYTAGYATTPFDIEQAAIQLTAEWFKYKDRIGKVSEGIEGQPITFSVKDIPPGVLMVLQTYRRSTPIY